MRGPGVSLRSTPGYYLASLQLAQAAMVGGTPKPAESFEKVRRRDRPDSKAIKSSRKSYNFNLLAFSGMIRFCRRSKTPLRRSLCR